MQVSFSITDQDGKRHEEEDLYASFEALATKLKTSHERDGLLSIYNDTDSYELTVFKDELGELIATVCLDSVPELATGKSVTVSMVSHPQHVHFEVQGEQIIIQGEGIDGDRCPSSDLLNALVGCGERYIALQKRLHADEPAWAPILSSLEQAAAQARASVTDGSGSKDR